MFLAGRMASLMTVRKKALPGGEDLFPPVTPGEILRHEFMQPLGLSMNGLARKLDVPPNRIMAILRAQRAITADTALRLSRYFGTAAEFWMNLQQNYELALARREKLAEIERKVPRRPSPGEQDQPAQDRRTTEAATPGRP